MRFLHKLAHYFFPGESNNQKAQIIQPSGLLFLILFLLGSQFIMEFIPRALPKILGYAANISPVTVISLTNQERAKSGLLPLTENPVLSQAAQAKGADMLTKGYWAHVAPDGTEPWKFFVNAGFKYRYAGENLARDFSNPNSAVDAWMASPSHRENMLSDKYKEIGVAVVEGNLAGVDTTIIVQFFGTKYSDVLPARIANGQVSAATESGAKVVNPSETEVSQNAAGDSATAKVRMKAASTSPVISPFSLTKNISLIIISVLLVVLVIDIIVIRHRKIARISGRTLAHLTFLLMILVIVLILKVGQIL